MAVLWFGSLVDLSCDGETLTASHFLTHTEPNLNEASTSMEESVVAPTAVPTKWTVLINAMNEKRSTAQRSPGELRLLTHSYLLDG